MIFLINSFLMLSKEQGAKNKDFNFNRTSGFLSFVFERQWSFVLKS